MVYRKILATLDGSKLAEQALRHIEQIAAPGTQVRVLSVISEDFVIDTGLSLAHAMNADYSLSSHTLPTIQDVIDPKALQTRVAYLLQASDWLKEKGFVVTVEARPGRAIDEIVKVASEGFDLIVMATHGRTGLTKFVLGSVTEGVLRRSPCPVLVISAHSPEIA
jgi:nucleotide-binding universal stress UspA family protein